MSASAAELAVVFGTGLRLEGRLSVTLDLHQTDDALILFIRHATASYIGQPMQILRAPLRYVLTRVACGPWV